MIYIQNTYLQGCCQSKMTLKPGNVSYKHGMQRIMKQALEMQRCAWYCRQDYDVNLDEINDFW